MDGLHYPVQILCKWTNLMVDCISSSTLVHSESSADMSTRTVPCPELLGGGCQILEAFPDSSFSMP